LIDLLNSSVDQESNATTAEIVGKGGDDSFYEELPEPQVTDLEQNNFHILRGQAMTVYGSLDPIIKKS
jgi:hypothetical protein